MHIVVAFSAMQYDTVLCIWRIINALRHIRSTVILLFFFVGWRTCFI